MSEKLAVVSYSEPRSPVYSVDCSLSCLRLQGVIDDEIAHTANSNLHDDDTI